MIITGIGSRKTPDYHLQELFIVCKNFIQRGWTLRSGGADGADSQVEYAFDECVKHGLTKEENKEIYLPWKGFNKNTSSLYDPPIAAYELAATIHPNWFACSRGAKALHARNTQQILGKNLDTPTNVVVCWTLGGEEIGGTATAMKLARLRGIPIVNLAINDEPTMVHLIDKIWSLATGKNVGLYKGIENSDV